MSSGDTPTSPPRFKPTAAALLVTLAVVVLFLFMIRDYLVALTVAAIFTATAFPLHRWFLKRLGGRKSLASALTLLTVIVAILVPIIAILTSLVAQARDIAKSASPWVKKLMADPAAAEKHIPSWLPLRDEAVEALSTISEKAGQISTEVAGYAAKAASGITTSAADVVLSGLIMLYAMFFFFRDGRSWLDASNRGLKVIFGGMEQRVLNRAMVVSRSTLRGALFIGLIQGTLGGIGLAVAGVPSPIFWGGIMAIASLIPVVGIALVWVPAVVFLLVTGETVAAVGLGLWCGVVVANVDNVLRPILVGAQAQLPDLVVLISTFGGLAMFGIAGLILGPVLAAITITLLQAAVEEASPEQANAETAPEPTAPSVDSGGKPGSGPD